MLRFGIRFCNKLKCTKRTYLTHKYTDDSVWLASLDYPNIPAKSAEELAVQIQERIQKKEYFSPDLIELLACKMYFLKDMKVFDLFVDILRSFRKSQQYLSVPESFHHAVVRSLLKLSKSLSLTDICMDRLVFGVFPDQWGSAILINHHLINNTIQDAFDVAVDDMLQEQMSSPVVQLLSMLICAKFITPLIDSSLSEPSETESAIEEEEVYERVKFVENEFYDDHFEVKNQKILCGKTLVFSTRQFGLHEPICRVSNLIGLALYEKFDEFLSKMSSLDESLVLPSNFFEVVRYSLENSHVRDDFKEGVPPYAQQRFITPARRDQVLGLLEGFENRFEASGGISGRNLAEEVEDLVTSRISGFEEEDIKSMEVTFKKWGMERDSKMLDESNMEKRKRMKLEVLDGLNEMIKREEMFAYVENPAVVCAIGEKLRPETKKLTGLQRLEIMAEKYNLKMAEKRRRLSMDKQR